MGGVSRRAAILRKAKRQVKEEVSVLSIVTQRAESALAGVVELVNESVDSHDARRAAGKDFLALVNATLRRAARASGGAGSFHHQLQRCALRRLTPMRIRSMRQELVESCRATSSGVMPRRATMVHTCIA